MDIEARKVDGIFLTETRPESVYFLGMKRLHNQMESVFRLDFQNAVCRLERFAFFNQFANILLVRNIFRIHIDNPGLIFTCTVRTPGSTRHQVMRRCISLAGTDFIGDVLENRHRNILEVTLVQADIGPHIEYIANRLDFFFHFVKMLQRRKRNPPA